MSKTSSSTNNEEFQILPHKSSPLKVVLCKKQPEIIYNCHMCSYKTEEKNQLGFHLIDAHLHKCKLCNFGILTQEALDVHVKDFHVKEMEGKIINAAKAMHNIQEADQTIERYVKRNYRLKPHFYKCILPVKLEPTMQKQVLI